jgi:hypothetical protein
VYVGAQVKYLLEAPALGKIRATVHSDYSGSYDVGREAWVTWQEADLMVFPDSEPTEGTVE